MPSLLPDTYPQILDNLPHVVMRLSFKSPAWGVDYVNKAIERYGYKREDFTKGKMTWNQLLHPDDRVMALKLAGDYIASGVGDFKGQVQRAEFM